MAIINSEVSSMFVTKIANSTPYPSGDPFFQTTPVDIDAGVRAFCRELGDLQAVFVPVTPAPGAENGMCDDNVADQIARHGGGRALGWAIWVSELFAFGEFHTVWVSPTGELIDVTPAAGGETSIAFAVDASYSPDFDFTERPPGRAMRTIERPWNTDIGTLTSALSPAQLAYEETRALRAGKDLASHLFDKITPSPLAKALDALFAAWAVRDRLILRTTSGNFSHDAKGFRIIQSKVANIDTLVEKLLADRQVRYVPKY